MNIRIHDAEGRVRFAEMVLARAPKVTAMNIAKRCNVPGGGCIEWWDLRFADAGSEPELEKRTARVDNQMRVWLYDPQREHCRVVGRLPRVGGLAEEQ